MPFEYLLATRDGQPVDPAAFGTAIPNPTVGETFMVGGGRQFRILAINDEVDAEGSRGAVHPRDLRDLGGRAV